MSNSSSQSQQGGGQNGHQSKTGSSIAPVSASLSPFTGIDVQVRFTNGENIGLRDVNRKGELLSGRVSLNPQGDFVELFVKINPEAAAVKAGRLILFTKGKDGQLTVQASSKRGARASYTQRVRISRAHEGKQIRVDPSTNNVYVACMTQNGISINCVALTYQKGSFWLLSQNQYAVETFVGRGGRVVVPGFYEKDGGMPEFVDFPEVCEFLDSISHDEKKELPLVSAYKPYDLKLEKLKDGELMVKLWSLRTGHGTGFLKSGHEVRISWQDIENMEPCALRTGQIVRFRKIEPITPEQQRQWNTKHTRDARGLQLVP
jgi:hypothetical protein